MRIIEPSKEEFFDHLDKPFNPPDASISKAEFHQEYYRLYNKLEAILSEFGENDSGGQGDYILEPLIAKSRGMGFEINKSAFVTKLLLLRLQELLISQAPNWEICLKSDNYDYYILIGPTSIRMHRDNARLLPQLNIG